MDPIGEIHRHVRDVVGEQIVESEISAMGFVREGEVRDIASNVARQYDSQLKNEIMGMGFLTSLPTDLVREEDIAEMATRSWVDGKGFLTSLPTDLVREEDIADMATRSWVDGKGFLTSLPTDLVRDSDIVDMATRSWVDGKGFLTEVSWEEVLNKPIIPTDTHIENLAEGVASGLIEELPPIPSALSDFPDAQEEILNMVTWDMYSNSPVEVQNAYQWILENMGEVWVAPGIGPADEGNPLRDLIRAYRDSVDATTAGGVRVGLNSFLSFIRGSGTFPSTFIGDIDDLIGRLGDEFDFPSALDILNTITAGEYEGWDSTLRNNFASNISRLSDEHEEIRRLLISIDPDYIPGEDYHTSYGSTRNRFINIISTSKYDNSPEYVQAAYRYNFSRIGEVWQDASGTGNPVADLIRSYENGIGMTGPDGDIVGLDHFLNTMRSNGMFPSTFIDDISGIGKRMGYGSNGELDTRFRMLSSHSKDMVDEIDEMTEMFGDLMYNLFYLPESMAEYVGKRVGQGTSVPTAFEGWRSKVFTGDAIFYYGGTSSRMKGDFKDLSQHDTFNIKRAISGNYGSADFSPLFMNMLFRLKALSKEFPKIDDSGVFRPF